MAIEDEDIHSKSIIDDLDNNSEISTENPSASTTSSFPTLTIPPQIFGSKPKARKLNKEKPEDVLLKSAAEAITSLKEQSFMSSPTSKMRTEDVFADYIARTLRSITDEKARRCAEFRIHAVLYEVLSNEERRIQMVPMQTGNASLSSSTLYSQGIEVKH